MVALEVLAKLTYILPPYLCARQSSPSAYIPVRGRPLEKFNSTDIMWSTTTKIGTSIFSYHALHYCNTNEHVKWQLGEWDIINGVIAVPLFFMGYDFTYYCTTTTSSVFSHENCTHHMNHAAGMVCNVCDGMVGFHRLLHTNAFYGWVHKHHHRQMAPFRGNADAINIHPVEMLGGEWNHLLWMHIVAICLPTGMSKHQYLACH
jgi:sterol desaturase/sphingolipid hydroxylase (fatty acid hydroxylase superfamily)